MTDQELMHFQIKGAKWGQRRFQYEDGSLTPAGRERYLKNPNDRRDGSGGSVTIAKPKRKVSKIEMIKKQRAKEAKLKADLEAKKAAEKLAVKRKNVLQDPEKLMANLHNSKYNFSRKEVEDAIAAFKQEDQLLQLAKNRQNVTKTVNRGKAIAEGLIKGLTIAVDGYQKYIELRNLLEYGSKQAPTPKKDQRPITFNIGGGSTSKNNNQKSPKTEKPKTEKPKKDDIPVVKGTIIDDDRKRFKTSRGKTVKNSSWTKHSYSSNYYYPLLPG